MKNTLFPWRSFIWALIMKYKWALVFIIGAGALTAVLANAGPDVFAAKNADGVYEAVPEGYKKHPVSGADIEDIKGDVLATMLYYDGKKQKRLQYVPGMIMFKPDGSPAYWCNVDEQMGQIELFITPKHPDPYADIELVPLNRELMETVHYYAQNSNGFKVLGPLAINF